MGRSFGSGNTAGSVESFILSTSASASTTSSTYVTLGSHTPATGTWYMSFSSTAKGSTSSQQMEYAIFVDSVVHDHSERRLDWNSGGQGNELWMTMHSQSIITTDGTDLVEVMYKTDIGTFTVGPRSLVFIKLI